jgi:hypothetical protein
VRTPYDTKSTYSQLLTVSSAAAAAGEYEVSYHALMAALHCAESADNAGRLVEVARLAREQLDTIDAGAPGHRLSSRTAAAHGHRSVFEMGAVTAEAAQKRVQSQVRLAEHRRARAGG